MHVAAQRGRVRPGAPFGPRNAPRAHLETSGWDEAAELATLSGRQRAALARRALRVLSVLWAYAAMAVLCWFSLTYGLLIYNLLGKDQEAAFANSWGLAVGIDNAKQWRSVAQTALVAAFELLLLERLGLLGVEKWCDRLITR